MKTRIKTAKGDFILNVYYTSVVQRNNESPNCIKFHKLKAYAAC